MALPSIRHHEYSLMTSVSLILLSSVGTSSHPVFTENIRLWLFEELQMVHVNILKASNIQIAFVSGSIQSKNWNAERCSPCQINNYLKSQELNATVYDPKTEVNSASLDLCLKDLKFSFANNSCKEDSLKAKSTSLKSKASCGGKTQLLHTTASFETVAYRVGQSFTLGRALSVTTDWFRKSLGRHHKKAERRREGGSEGEKVIKPRQLLSVTTWKREGQVNGGCLQWKIWLILVLPPKPLKVLTITT